MTEEKKEGDIQGELRTLGEQLASAVRALWESEESQSARREIQQGLVEMGQHLNTAIKSAQESEAGKRFGQQVQDTVQKARESDVGGQIQQGIATGLSEVNKALSQLLDQWSAKKPPEPPAS